ncbi:DinB superfamily protein [Bryocella elongata]|uniref:DinB superfamily protein n=1 Tax=Bryocella elongata TaxID=863522 RepID=A0A1H6BIM6_9BACT|nr:DinB family protein [Bryocella elongata]SEG60563.1 DinB superfamily protein [Bryocella elongata]
MAKIPYLDVLGSDDPLETIRSTPARLAKVYDALTPEQLEARSAPGKWNLREVMAHLADCEVAWAWRLRFAYGAESPVIQPFDQDSWAKPYSAYTLAEARATLAALRAWNVALVGALTDADKAKIYTHPERGEEPLWTIVQIMAGHDLHHLKVLEAL